MKPEYESVAAMTAPCVNEIIRESYGTIFIIGPFNYPIFCTVSSLFHFSSFFLLFIYFLYFSYFFIKINQLIPLIGAIAGGNCAVVKPSELAPASGKIMEKLIFQYLDKKAFAIYQGSVYENQQLLARQWDKIFFTGSTRVGRIVMEAAAKHLTEVCLELGGKSPVYIDETVTDLQLIANRILWGKFANAGQTCIAPDYILCHEKVIYFLNTFILFIYYIYIYINDLILFYQVHDEFIRVAINTVKQFYGEDPHKSESYARIISELHTERIKVNYYSQNLSYVSFN